MKELTEGGSHPHIVKLLAAGTCASSSSLPPGLQPSQLTTRVCSFNSSLVLLPFSAGYHQRAPCIVMEYCVHDCLWEVMRKRQKVAGTRYGMELKVRILRDAAKGMRFLHGRAKPVIHRDLKAKNILIDIRGTAKVSRATHPAATHL